MTDRLETIERAHCDVGPWHGCLDCYDDIEWFIAEVKRLRGIEADWEHRYQEHVRMYGCPCSQCRERIRRIYHDLMGDQRNCDA